MGQAVTLPELLRLFLRHGIDPDAGGVGRDHATGFEVGAYNLVYLVFFNL